MFFDPHDLDPEIVGLEFKLAAVIRNRTEFAENVAAERFIFIDRLEKDGVITGYRASVNPEVFDYRIKAFINLEVEPVRKKEFYPYITDCPNVIECNCVTGDYSMLMEVVFHTTSELDQFIGQLQHFGRTKTQIVFSTSVEHRGIPLGDTRIPILEQEEEKG